MFLSKIVIFCKRRHTILDIVTISRKGIFVPHWPLLWLNLSQKVIRRISLYLVNDISLCWRHCVFVLTMCCWLSFCVCTLPYLPTYPNQKVGHWAKPVWMYMHLAKLIPQRFLKPAVCKYPTTVNNSEINILLPKPCPWMGHLICGNRVRNGSDRKPETGKTHSLKLALFKNPIGAAL